MYLIIDQGTSSTKGFLFEKTGEIFHEEKIKHRLHYISKNHIECDASKILNACKTLITNLVSISNSPILAMGLSVQRSTFLFWDRKSIKPVTMALSWQDSSSKNIVEKIAEHSDWIYKKTGLPLSPHFGGPKYQKMITDDPSLYKKIQNGDLVFGSLSSYITHALTQTASIDHSIASRTLLLNVNSCDWSQDCLDLFNIPISCLPKLMPTKADYGRVLQYDFNLNCVIGDQQAALIGQNGLSKNSIGMNFGTSASILKNTGNYPKIINGLVSSILFSDSFKKVYVSEGTINACNSLFYYLEDILGIKHKKMIWDRRCKNLSTEGVFISGFSGIAAPYWISGFEDIYHKINKNNKDEIIRAAMESIGFLVNDILDILDDNNSIISSFITASGGGARDSLLQFISDISGQIIRRPNIRDKTANGVFRILCNNYENVATEEVDLFKPKLDRIQISKKIKLWRKIISSLR